MNTTKPAVKPAAPAVTVTVVPYDSAYEKAVRQAMASTPREGQSFSNYTNVDGHYGR